MNYAIKDATNVTFYDKASGQPIMYSDYLNTFTLELSSTTVFAKAKGTNKIAFDGTKTGTVAMEAEVFELKYLALMLGSEFLDQSAEVAKREVFSADSKSATLSASPVTGSCIAFALDKDKRTQLNELPLTVNGSNITLSESIPATVTNFVVYYMTNIPKAKKLTVSTTSSGGNLMLVGDTVVKDEFGGEEFVQIKINNCKVQQKINLQLSAENVAKFTATFELLGDENNDIVELTLID